MELFDFADKEAEKLRAKRKEILGQSDKKLKEQDENIASALKKGLITEKQADELNKRNKPMSEGGSPSANPGELKREIALNAKNKLESKALQAKIAELDKKEKESGKPLAMDTRPVMQKKLDELKKQTTDKPPEKATLLPYEKRKYKVDELSGNIINKKTNDVMVRDGQGNLVKGKQPPAPPTPPKAKILDVKADRRIAGSTYKPGRGQDMGEEYEEPSMQMANFAKSKTERDANARSSAAPPLVNVHAPSSKETTYNGSMGSGRASLTGGKYGLLNRQEQGGMI